MEVIKLTSDSFQESPLTIFTSDDPNIFMSTPADKRNTSPTKTNKEIDKIIKRISSSPKKHPAEPEIEQLISIIPHQVKQTSAPTGDNITNAPQKKNIETNTN